MAGPRTGAVEAKPGRAVTVINCPLEQNGQNLSQAAATVGQRVWSRLEKGYWELLFSWPQRTTRGHAVTWRGEEFKTDQRKHLFTQPAISLWNSQPREVIEARPGTRFAEWELPFL